MALGSLVLRAPYACSRGQFYWEWKYQACVIWGRSGKKKNPATALGSEMKGVHNEQPLPAFESGYAIKIIHCRHKVAREHSTDRTADVEDVRPLCELIFAIPAADDIFWSSVRACSGEGRERLTHSRIERALRETYEEAQSIDLLCCFAFGQQYGESCPSDLQCCQLSPPTLSFLPYLTCRYPNGWPNSGKKQIADRPC